MHALRAKLQKDANVENLKPIDEPTPWERVQRCNDKHFGTGEEEIFAVSFSDVFSAAYYGDLSMIKAVRAINKKPIDFLKKQGETMTHYAARGRRLHVIKYCLEEGSDVNATNNMGWTAAHIAAQADFGDVIELLYENGGTLKLQDISGYTAAHIAASTNSVNALRALYMCQPEPRTTDLFLVRSRNGSLPMHMAAMSGHEEAVRFLVQIGVDLTLVDNTGETAAHKAGRSGNSTLMDTLKELGADLGVLNAEGDTPLHLLWDNPRYA